MPIGKENNMNEANVLSKLVDKIRSKKPQQQNNPYVKHLGGDSYEIGKNIATEIRGMTHEQIMQYDWGKGRLSFLFRARWEAKVIEINFKEGGETLRKFWGKWYDGDFIGGIFYGIFYDGTFLGEFAASFENFKAHPSKFRGGKCTSSQDGVLGINKIGSIVIGGNSPSRMGVSLLELKEGYYITIIDSFNHFYSFKVEKNIDNQNADTILQEVGGSSVYISWGDIMQASQGSADKFNQTTWFTIGKKVKIPHLSEKVKGTVFSIEVSSKQSAPSSNQTLPTVYKLNMELLDPLPYPAPKGKKPVATLHFLGQDEVKKFQKLQREIENGDFAMHLNNIIQGIYHGYITGYDKYLALSWLFNDIQGSPVKGDQFENSMKWMENFILLVPERFVKSKTQGGKYVKNETALLSFERKMKSLVGPYLSRISKQSQPSPQSGGRSQRKKIVPESHIREWVSNNLKQNILKNV